MNRKDAAKDPEAKGNYYIQINTSSTRVKRYGKIYRWPGLTTKKLTTGSPKLDITLSQNV